jgi:hypothetical protein
MHIIESNYTIAYGILCARAAFPGSPEGVGPYLREIAEWCNASGFPPLNALAVNATTGIPGDSYNGAGGFSIINWPADLAACVRFTGYPATIP